MSTSGSTTLTFTRNDIIKAALRKLSVLAEGQTPTAEQYTNATTALNALSAAFQVDGMQLWKKTSYSFSMTAGTSVYNIGVGQTLNTPFPLKIHQAYITDSSDTTRIPLQVISHYNYHLLPLNSSSGRPVQLMYQPFNGYGKINLWPEPDSSTASNYTVHIIYQTQTEDFVNSTDDMDYPKEWANALIYGLASDLASEYSIPLNDRKDIDGKAKYYHDKALEFGTEEASFYLQPNRTY